MAGNMDAIIRDFISKFKQETASDTEKTLIRGIVDISAALEDQHKLVVDTRRQVLEVKAELKRLNTILARDMKLIAELANGKVQATSEEKVLSPEEKFLQLKNKFKDSVIADKTINDMEFSTRTMWLLKRSNLKTAQNILNTSEADLLRIPQFGVGTLREVRNVLKANGYQIPTNWRQ
jgi:DNA-directed RNA polymerase subunit alpha